MKQCSKCGINKPLTEFVKKSKSPDGCQPFCKKCQSSYQKEYRARHRARDADKHKGQALKQNYGISLDQYKALIEQQGDNCPICENKLDHANPRKVHLDHCHKTGSIRGVLCGACNTGIGHLGDDIERLSRAIAYLAP